jgi:hypothetical protein
MAAGGKGGGHRKGPGPRYALQGMPLVTHFLQPGLPSIAPPPSNSLLKF